MSVTLTAALVQGGPSDLTSKDFKAPGQHMRSSSLQMHCGLYWLYWW